MATTENPNAKNFAELLQTAVTQPGTLSAAYTAFHNYSLGNVLLAMGQCHARKIQLGPMATYNRWQELRRNVKKGEKAITLCMPVTVTDRKAAAAGDEDAKRTVFIYKNRWFVLAQTEGEPLPAQLIPAWDKDRALSALDVTEIPFDLLNGNVGGYALKRTVAVSPVNPHPFKTLFHELAHVLLGHTAEQQNDGEKTSRELREAEAEAVALLCCEALSLPGADDSRAYIQHWYGQGNPIPEPSARKILKIADQILKAGRETAANETEQN